MVKSMVGRFSVGTGKRGLPFWRVWESGEVKNSRYSRVDFSRRASIVASTRPACGGFPTVAT